MFGNFLHNWINFPINFSYTISLNNFFVLKLQNNILQQLLLDMVIVHLKS